MTTKLSLTRVALAMALRALTGRLERGINSATGAAIALLTLGEDMPCLELVGDLGLTVAEAGARLSGIVAGCGCDADLTTHCYRHLEAEHPCSCQCHEASRYLRTATSDVRSVAFHLRRAGEALADSAPKPEADATDGLLCEACGNEIPEADLHFCPEDSTWFHRACIDEAAPAEDDDLPWVTVPGIVVGGQ